MDRLITLLVAGLLRSPHSSQQSTPDAPSLCFDLKMLLPADIVMDIGIVFYFLHTALGFEGC